MEIVGLGGEGVGWGCRMWQGSGILLCHTCLQRVPGIKVIGVCSDDNWCSEAVFGITVLGSSRMYNKAMQGVSPLRGNRTRMKSGIQGALAKGLWTRGSGYPKNRF